MSTGTERPSKGTWYGRYLSHLKSLAGIGAPGRKPDTGALAELRSAARGRDFELRALRHVVPYIQDSDRGGRHRIRVALTVGQLFAAHPPTGDSDPDGGSVYARRSIGRCLGAADGGIEGRSSDEQSRSITPMERHLHTLVASDMDGLSQKLRGTLDRLSSHKISLTVGEFARLLQDLTYWNDQEKRVQYQWVQDFYSTKNENRPEGDE